MTALPHPDPRHGGVVVFGVLNVTEDSFSDGGRYLSIDDAVAHGCEMAAQGADVIDVGGESTRPGAVRIAPEIEIGRVVPVIRTLAGAGVRCSIDTMHSRVAAAAIEAGATIVNDVSGGQADPDMATVVAAAGLPWVLMHWRSDAAFVHHGEVADYPDVVANVRDELLAQVDRALAAGVDAQQVIIDPGLGFGKNAEHNWALLRELPQLVATGFPVLVGASRKRFLGALLADGDEPRPADQREFATAAVSLRAAGAGVWGIRVHDVRATTDVLKVQRMWNGVDSADHVRRIRHTRGGK